MKFRNILIAGLGLSAVITLAVGLSTGLGGDTAADAAATAGPAKTEPPAQTASDATTVALGEVKPADHVLGDPDAPVTMIEYASMTCPHCATFHQETLPKLKENFIEPGRVKLVFRHYPLDQRAMRASLLAECFEGKRFFSMLDILFKQQQGWARADNPDQHFRKLAGMAGLDGDTVNGCLNDDSTRDNILRRQLKARRDADVRSTPSFLIDGETVAGNPGYEALAKKLRNAGA